MRAVDEAVLALAVGVSPVLLRGEGAGLLELDGEHVRLHDGHGEQGDGELRPPPGDDALGEVEEGREDEPLPEVGVVPGLPVEEQEDVVDREDEDVGVPEDLELLPPDFQLGPGEDQKDADDDQPPRVPGDQAEEPDRGVRAQGVVDEVEEHVPHGTRRHQHGHEFMEGDVLVHGNERDDNPEAPAEAALPIRIVVDNAQEIAANWNQDHGAVEIKGPSEPLRKWTRR
mmetsp:Transcript_32262/g.78573  ORF Transcript_32262/g.78573 Transcript_32262/m.78573 type:complete len:228 (+) Transcript_32262:1049-1732(+)